MTHNLVNKISDPTQTTLLPDILLATVNADAR